MVEENQRLAQAMTAVQEVKQTIQQAEASGNIQQVYEAQRVLHLARQRLAEVQSELSQSGESEDDQMGLVQQQLVDGEYPKF